MENQLSAGEIELLRSSGLINNQEVALRVGDLVVAENIVTRQRRVVADGNRLLSESNRRVLKG
tara:strand:+ start:867 stop:1055 length:189 start_codon:yes stop_codon:yes gene_type:complete